DLGPQFLSPLDGALMLGAVIMSLLPQSDYFGSQQPVLLLERGLFLPQRTCLRLARLLGGHHASHATIADCLRRVPQKIAPRRFFLQTRSPNIYCGTALCASVTGTCRKLCGTLRTFVYVPLLEFNPMFPSEIKSRKGSPKFR